MNSTKKPRLISVVYVIHFKTREVSVRFKQAEIEAAFSDFGTGQSRQTNVSDTDDATKPRIIFGNDTKRGVFSQVACQLHLAFPTDKLSLESELEIIRKNVTSFKERVSKVFDSSNFSHSGLVYDIAFPSDTPINELQENCFHKFLAVPQMGKIAAAQFTVGFELDDLYLTVGGSVYENRQVDVTMTAGEQSKTVSILEMPVIEYGMMFKVDINDLIRRKNGGTNISLPEELLSRAEKFITIELETFSGINLRGT